MNTMMNQKPHTCKSARQTFNAVLSVVVSISMVISLYGCGSTETLSMTVSSLSAHMSAVGSGMSFLKQAVSDSQGSTATQEVGKKPDKDSPDNRNGDSSPGETTTSETIRQDGSKELTTTVRPDEKHFFTVKIVYGPSAEISQDAKLKVEMLGSNEARRAALNDLLQVKEGEYVPSYLFSKIALTVDDKEVQPTKPVEVVIETNLLEWAQSDAIEAALLGSTDVKTLSVENLTGKDEAGVESADPQHARIKFSTTRLGDLGLAPVVAEKHAADFAGVRVSVLGARSKTVVVDVQEYNQQLEEGRSLWEVLAPRQEPAHTWASTYWVRATDERPEGERQGYAIGRVVRDGQLAEEIFGSNGTAQPVKVSMKDQLALVWASGEQPSAEASASENPNAEEMASGIATGQQSQETEEGAAAQTGASGTTSPQNIVVPDTKAGDEPQTRDDKANSTIVVQEDDVVQAAKPMGFEREYIASDGKTYRVTVGFDEKSGIPQGTDLVVSEVATGSGDYFSHVMQAAKKLDVASTDINFAKALDISLVDPVTGEKVQPTKDVSVRVELFDGKANSGDRVGVVHFGDDIETLNAQSKNGAVEFATGGFSVFVIAKYSVDFHWGDYVYSIAGESQALLSEMFKRLGITQIQMSDIASVAFSDPSLIAVEKTATDWTLRSLKPFATEETLSITLNGGRRVEIRVTDEQTDGGSLSSTWPEGLIQKALTGFNGDFATYTITVNPNMVALNNDAPLVLKDTFSENQSINYGSIRVTSEPARTVTYDYNDRTGTFSIPDSTKVIITYTTRVTGDVGEDVTFSNKAELGLLTTSSFVPGASAEVEETRTISPTGSDITGTGGVYTIDLYAYANGHMEQGLEGATFRLLDSNRQPIYYGAGDHVGEQITFTTDESGYVKITLDAETDGVSIRKNTVYFLEMTAAPYQRVGDSYVYYQEDNTYYSFLITDDPSYSYGDVYGYFNGDVLKVRCYPEEKGINVTKRFSGNYTLTDEQKAAIVFKLQKEVQASTIGWEDVESHTYAEFSYGSINFAAGSSAGQELEDNGTYRIIEENTLPDELKDVVDEHATVFLTHQIDGKPIREDTNEFFVNPDDKAYSYDFTFTNEYVDHKLTVIKIDENTGDALPEAEFKVYKAVSDAEVATYSTGQEGAFTVKKTDAGANYATDTLYYAMETAPPSGYLAPHDAERVYFYFSGESQAVPDGLPAGATATDLTTSYNTVTVADKSDKVRVPVTVVWGVKGDEAWPQNVDKVVVGLYQSIDGADPTQVVDDENNPRTLELTSDTYYDNSTFSELPARQNGRDIIYSVVEEGIYSGDSDISSQFARSSSVSGTGWHVVNNQEAIAITVQKEWYDIGGTPIDNPSGKSAITYDLYRTTTETSTSSFTRAELNAFLANAQLVRSGLTVPAGNWSMTVDSLQKTDAQGNAYYYYALENVPDNQEDSYVIQAATAAVPRTLTIKNLQTPTTVTISADDLQKTYGDDDPAYVLDASIKEPGATVRVSEAPDASGNYTVWVSSSDGTNASLHFTVSRELGENAGTYAITPSGDALQTGYRVLFEPGTLTINQASATIKAGASKVYGDADPALVTVTGLKNDEKPEEVLRYTVSREEGEDVGSYPITLEGQTDQGNYRVFYDKSNPVFTIDRAQVTVTAASAEKTYGQDDPALTATVVGLKRDDPESVIKYDLARTEGEDIGVYDINLTGDAQQENYTVTYEYESAKFTIKAAHLVVTVEANEEKTYGDDDPEWGVAITGLQWGEAEGKLSSVLDEQTGVRTYTYSVGEGSSAVTLLTFEATRAQGEDVGEYSISLSGESAQGNYTIEYQNDKNLSIRRAELTVVPDHKVKAAGTAEDPLLTATVTGWKNGDDNNTHAYSVGEGDNAGIITWTYTRETADGDITLLTFTLKRDAGEENGEYTIAAQGAAEQSNYFVEFQTGTFEILDVLDVDVTQPLIDHADADANPEYNYVATLNLAGTGLTEYNRNGFETVDGVPTHTFTLPTSDKTNMETLKVPGGASLEVKQLNTNDDYTTALTVDGNSYVNPTDALLCKIENVVSYHEIAYTHTRISMPVSARAAVGQTEEGAIALEGREGAVGIPDGARQIDASFADEMHSKIGYTLPTDKYYMYDHASLYTMAGIAVDGGSNVTELKYDRERSVWQYKTAGEFADVPANTQLVLFYLPKFVCKIGTEKFYSIKAAVEYAETHGKTATIEMLIGKYSIRSSDDVPTIPEDCNITITTATTEYEGTGKAVIDRSMGYVNGYLFRNNGTLVFDNAILDGVNVRASNAMVLNESAVANLTISENATLRNASGDKGGAIYVSAGTVTVNGALTGNKATSGGAVYVNGGSLTIGSTASVSSNEATTGGAIYVAEKGSEVEIVGSVSSNKATSGGAVYNNKGKVTLSNTGTLLENEAISGGAIYQNDGELTVNGQIENNKATGHGAAIYLNGGSCTVETTGVLSGNVATENGGAVYQSGGTMSSSGTLSGNTAKNGGGVYRVGGALTVGGTVSQNTVEGSGGGVYSAGGDLTVTASISKNTAADGGGIYMNGHALMLTGGSVSDNTATINGGAVHALNATTTVDGVIVEKNEATGNGGAFYTEGGSVTVQNVNSKLSANKASAGGAIYATSGAITLTYGDIEENTATANGGAIYVGSASVNIEGGRVINNVAEQGNGGAIYTESGTVTISDGTQSGNKAEQGNGGAVYASTGTVGYTGGNIAANKAVNGAGIFTDTGIVNISASITSNTATNGGAVGVGSTNARLYFTGDAEVDKNTMNSAQSNVYLDVDSELVINANSLNSGKKIGVYVPGDINSDQVVNHGDVTGYFGAYASAGTLKNLVSVFKSDRFTDLAVGYEYNRLYWLQNLKYDVYYLKDYSVSEFPPTTDYTKQSTKVCSNRYYAPRTRESDIYDLVTAMKLYEAHNDDFTKNVDKNYASMAVYAYTFSDKALGNTFSNYLKRVEWDGASRKWKLIKQDGTEAPADTTKLVIFYSAPAYLTIVNNNKANLTLDIANLNVLNKDACKGVYGFVTAKNGATIQTLRTISDSDLNMKPGDSIKLMFPGAQGQYFTLSGAFTGEGAGASTSVSYTYKNGAEQTISGTGVNLSYALNTDDEAAELIFGDPLPICKIGEVPFSTLKAAMEYAKAQKTATGNASYTIEMLVDYLVPKDDVLDIPAGYDITFTTASKEASTLPYTGNGTRATLSRDTGNSGASITALNSTLSVNNLVFDGRSLTAGGAGGAVSATNCTTVTLQNCDFKGYRADNGGAIYVDNKNAGSSLTVEDCNFYNCQTNASVDKAGGGGLWTTARELYVRRCTFDFCACLKGKAQAGSIFHNIRSNWSKDSKTEISDCTFSNSYAEGGSGGTVETDALDVTISNCEFHGSYTNKAKGNGGAINALAGDVGKDSNSGWVGTYNGECSLTVSNCLFDDCRAANNGNGGAIVSSMWYVTIENSKFVNNQSKYGGAVKMTNANAKWLHINGCTFENCTATDTGGAVHAAVPTVNVDGTEAGTYLDATPRDGKNHFIDCMANRGGGIDNDKDGASVTMANVSFARCAARTNSGGALYTKAQTLNIGGASNTFEDCSGYGNGGAVYQFRNAASSSVTLQNCEFTRCEANNVGNGGGLYANAQTLTISGEENGFSGCTAANSGGGIYHDYAGTTSIENCGFTNCVAKAAAGGGLYDKAYTLTITGNKSIFKECSAQTDGGGLYHEQSANGSSFTFKDGSFEGCTAVGDKGGAVCTNAKGVEFASCIIKDNTSKAQGGGVWVNSSNANFAGCSISGNSVTNSDSKGGGVYVSGGTTTFRGNTVSGCSAANGGGWYQNNGSLYILGGSVSGSATNGGGLYMNDGNTKVYHYSGTIAGTATSNGGGVYKNNGTYTIGNGVYEGTAYSDASIGDVSVGENDSLVYSASATNGGGIYQNVGTINLNEGCSVNGQATNNGGGIWNKTTVNHNGGDVNGSALNGGGVWQTDTANGKYTLNGGTITGMASQNGGAFYQGGNSLNINGGAVVGRKTTVDDDDQTIVVVASSAENGGGVYVAAGTTTLNANASIAGASASENGGGVYVADGTFNLNGGDNTAKTNNGVIADNTATNGGGVYVAGGTLSFKRGRIIKNTASENGGGVYHAGGTFSMTTDNNATVCGVIGGSTEDGNTADMGAGIFVADGQTASFDDGASKTMSVSYNHARAQGGGIAVGGPNAVLKFKNAVTIRHNTMGANNIECNVYLNQDSNTVIQNNNLNQDAYIGVYASDDQDAGHGLPGKPFGTYDTGKNQNLNVYHNDRRPFLYGMQGSSNREVVWPEFVCKITDADGKLLYKDTVGSPAVYAELENHRDASGAFKTLNVASTTVPELYQKNDDGTFTMYTDESGNGYQVQMLVQNYELGAGKQIKLDADSTRKVVLTTASTVEDECGFKYTGDARFNATIVRTAETSCMFYVGQSWEVTLSNITMDGGGKKATEEGAILRLVENGSVVLDTGAVLQNGATNNKAGGGAYLRDSGSSLTMNPGSQIKDCSAGTNYGGGVDLNNGTFTMNGGAINGCSAAYGGGIAMSNRTTSNTAKVFMTGGEITGNRATSGGGGIYLMNDRSQITFSGYCVVTDNTLNNERCNVQLTQDKNNIINANGLDGKSEIGIYTVGDIFTKHGEKATPFGTWHVGEEKFYCFVNDVDPILHGVKGPESGDLIYWEGRPLIRVEKEVVSDRSADKEEEFTYTVQLALTDKLKTDFFKYNHNQYGDMDFNMNGTATVKLKHGESKTASLPFDFFEYGVTYTVTEELSEGQRTSYTVEAQKDDADAQRTTVVSGKLGENISTDVKRSTSLSKAAFQNTRTTGDLTISKRVVSDIAADRAQDFTFDLALDDTTITKEYAATKNDESTSPVSFEDGVAHLVLKDGDTVTIHDLPTALKYAVEENLSDTQRLHIRTSVSKDGAEPVYALKQEGTIGEHSTDVLTLEGRKTVYASRADFENDFLDIVCKITNRSRTLLYYRDAAGNLQPAVYSHLEDAYAQINSGNLRTSGNGTVTGALRIEMVVPAYTMEKTATLDSGKTVTLSTALTTDTQYPYNKGVSDGVGNVSTVTRGFADGSMMSIGGTLTLDKITLDGASNAETPITASGNGGIVDVVGGVRLTVNSGATLRNSSCTGNGGAICLANGSSLAMSGTIENCAATEGGGVYGSAGFATITTSGSITGCRAQNSGGAICAANGTSLNMNAGTRLTGNSAGANGGAVSSDTNIILRGVIGGTGTNEGNSAGADGGGVYVGGGATFTMYAGSSLSGNRAVNGGGLAAQSTVRITDGTLSGNSATEKGGAVYVTENANVTVSGASTLNGNEAKQGGAVYGGGTLTMTGGNLTENVATEKGGAIYVAAGKGFAMSGGNIKDGNRSPEGAVSTGEGAVLAFSGGSNVSGNTNEDGTKAMNVFLGYDSNSIITTPGLAAGAYIGVYVADGMPEDDSIQDAVSNPIYCDHGLSARNFGTYTGNNIRTARLNQFVNDRDTSLTGRSGAQISESDGSYFAMWEGKGLQLRVQKLETNGSSTNASDISFVLVNANDVVVWTGASGADGLVAIPWGPEERANGNLVTFAPKSSYRLRQTAANQETVRPAGEWTMVIGRDNSVTWEAVPSEEESVDRTLDISSPADPGEKAYLGDTFGLLNDTKPKLTYNATGGRLADNSAQRTDIIAFSTTDTSHDYTINEVNPTWDSHVFKHWATMEKAPAPEDENKDEYFTYTQNENIVFYRGTNEDASAKGYSKGDLTLYAQWDEVVCKVTDREGTLLYVNGSPAVYGKLEDGFEAYNAASAYTFTYQNGARATARRIEMLVGEYTINRPLRLNRGKTVMLTTAPTTDTDGYAYTGAEGSTSVITRGSDCDTSMITNNSNLTLMNITLDGNGDAQTVVCDGGILRNAQSSAVLTIASGATLRNSKTEGNGAAVYVSENTTLYLSGGTIIGNESTSTNPSEENGNGGGIYLCANSKARLSGHLVFGDNYGDTALPDEAKNGGYEYHRARQDIYIAGYASEDEEDTSANSLIVAGDITSADGSAPEKGSIWVWAADQPRYKTLCQFAKYEENIQNVENTLSAFRNGRADVDTGADRFGQYLYGIPRESDTGRNVYWYGVEGSRKVILRKVGKNADSTYDSLGGAEFSLYRMGASTPLYSGASGPNGVFFVGELDVGTYEIAETSVGGNEGYAVPSSRFRFKVDLEKGVTDMDGNPINAIELSE